jgi:hypothetical protein
VNAPGDRLGLGEDAGGRKERVGEVRATAELVGGKLRPAGAVTVGDGRNRGEGRREREREGEPGPLRLWAAVGLARAGSSEKREGGSGPPTLGRPGSRKKRHVFFFSFF